MILHYFHEVEQVLSSYKGITALNLDKRIINDSFGVLKGQAKLNNGTLDILEVVRISDTNQPIKK